jgi:predicted nucleic acid-binding protein
MSHLRISTHAAIFANPLRAEEAAHNVETLLHLLHVRTLAEEDGLWDLYREVTQKMPTRGNDVPDAHLATLLRQHGVATLYPNDRDFRKFDFLNVRHPFARATGPQQPLHCLPCRTFCSTGRSSLTRDTYERSSSGATVTRLDARTSRLTPNERSLPGSPPLAPARPAGQ